MKMNLLLASSFALAMLATSPQAATIQDLSSDPDLAVYLKFFPDVDETQIFMQSAVNVNSVWGSLDSNSAQQDVLFESTNLITGSEGFASISGSFSNLKISTPDLQFGDITFAVAGATSFWLRAYDATDFLIGEYLFEGLTPATQLQNILAIATTANFLMTSVVLTVAGTSGNFSDIKLVELSSISPRGSVTEVPLPAALPLLAAALAGVGFMGRRRRQTALS